MKTLPIVNAAEKMAKLFDVIKKNNPDESPLVKNCGFTHCNGSTIMRINSFVDPSPS